jgi:hypothetical protein
MSNIGVGERRTYDNQVRPKFRRVSNEDATLGVHDQVVIVDSGDEAVTITLPNVGEAAGKVFTITANDGDGNTVTIEDNADESGLADEAIVGDGGQRVLYSDGLHWHILASIVGETT